MPGGLPGGGGGGGWAVLELTGALFLDVRDYFTYFVEIKSPVLFPC